MLPNELAALKHSFLTCKNNVQLGALERARITENGNAIVGPVFYKPPSISMCPLSLTEHLGVKVTNLSLYPTLCSWSSDLIFESVHGLIHERGVIMMLRVFGIMKHDTLLRWTHLRRCLGQLQWAVSTPAQFLCSGVLGKFLIILEPQHHHLSKQDENSTLHSHEDKLS